MGIFSSIFRIVLPIVAAVIGFVITGGNPMGAVYGYGIGSMIAGALFPPEAENKQSSGPGQLQLSTSNYGGAIPVVYGARRVAGNLIWAGNLVTVAVEHDAGGGGCMGGDATYTTYEYYISFAMAICVGRGKQEVRRIFKNKDEYVYNRRDGRAYSITNTQSLIQQYGCAMAGAVINGQIVTGQLGTGSFAMTMYDGTQTTADPTMAAAVANPCPYKNLCYVVFPNFYLGNTPMMPQLSFEVSEVIANEDAVPSVVDSLVYTSGEFICQQLYAEGYLWLIISDASANPIRIEKVNPDTMSVEDSATLNLGTGETIAISGTPFGLSTYLCYQGGFLYLLSLNRLSKISCASLSIQRQWFVGTVTIGYPDGPDPWFYGAKSPYAMESDDYRPETGANWENYWVKLGPVFDSGEWSWDKVGWSTGTNIRGTERYQNGISAGPGSDYVSFWGEGQLNTPVPWSYGSYNVVHYRLRDGYEELVTGNPLLSIGEAIWTQPISAGSYRVIFNRDCICLLDSSDIVVASISRTSFSDEYIRSVAYLAYNDTLYVSTTGGVRGLSIPELTVTYGPYVVASGMLCVQTDNWSDRILVMTTTGYCVVLDTSLNLVRSWSLASLGFTEQNGLSHEYYLPLIPAPNSNIRGLGHMFFVGYTSTGEYAGCTLIKMEYPPDFLYVEDITPQDVSEDVLTNPFYGNGLSSDIIDTEGNYAGKAYARDADLLIAPAFDRQRSILDALQYILQHHDGFITYYDGKITHRQFETRSADIAFAQDTDKSDAFADASESPNWRSVIE